MAAQHRLSIGGPWDTPGIERPMLGIKRETDYAARIVLHLACLGEGAQVQVREIAEERLLPLYFVRRIVARLASSGILQTTRGMGGGIRLGRPASEITLLDVVRVMEGGVVLNQCEAAPDTCPLSEDCPVHDAWVGATRALEKHLAGVRFDRLASQPEEHIAAHRRTNLVTKTGSAEETGAWSARSCYTTAESSAGRNITGALPGTRRTPGQGAAG
jgi:Rrf2 family protein